MAEVTDSEKSGADDGPEEPAFDQLMALHRGAGRGMMIYAALLVVGGIALVVLAVTGAIPWLVGLVTGVIAMAVAVFPYRESVERRERVEGMGVLADEWGDLDKRGDLDDQARRQFAGLLGRLYSVGRGSQA